MEQSREQFSQFVSLCRSVTDGDYEVVKLVQRRFNKCSPDFIASESFRTRLECTMQRIEKDMANKYVHIKAFVTALKSYEEVKDSKARKRLIDASESSDVDSLPDIKRPRRILEADESVKSVQNEVKTLKVKNGIKPLRRITPQSAEPSATNERSGKTNDKKSRNLMGAVTKLHEKSEKKETPVVSDARSCESDVEVNAASSPDPLKQPTDSEGDRTTTPTPVQESETDGPGSVQRDSSDCKAAKGSNRQIKKLEALLQEIRNEIEVSEARELTLEDLDDEENNYLLIDKYKKKFVQVWNKLCSIKGREPTTGRTIERRFRFDGCRYPEVNRKVEKFVNKFREFPDYQDIRDIVIRSNNKYKLKLSKKKVNSLATDIFTDVGNRLQERRQEDFASTFGSSVTDRVRKSNDPALFDKKLRAKLDKNKEIGKNRLESVIRKFAEKQDDGDTSSEEEETDEEEEEEKVKVVKSCSITFENPCTAATATSASNTAESGSEGEEIGNTAAAGTVSVLTQDDGVGVELKKYLLTDRVKKISREVLTKILNEDKTSLKSPYKNRRKSASSPRTPTSKRSRKRKPSISSSSDDVEPSERGNSRRSPPFSGDWEKATSKSPQKHSPIKFTDLTTPLKGLSMPMIANSPRSPLVKLEKLDIEPNTPVKVDTVVEDLVKGGERLSKGCRRLSLKKIPSCTVFDQQKCDAKIEEIPRLSDDVPTSLIHLDSDDALVCDSETTAENNEVTENKEQGCKTSVISVCEKIEALSSQSCTSDELPESFNKNSDIVPSSLEELSDNFQENGQNKESDDNAPDNCTGKSPEQVFDKLEVYIDRACDDNYIEIFSDDETKETKGDKSRTEQTSPDSSEVKKQGAKKSALSLQKFKNNEECSRKSHTQPECDKALRDKFEKCQTEHNAVVEKDDPAKQSRQSNLNKDSCEADLLIVSDEDHAVDDASQSDQLIVLDSEPAENDRLDDKDETVSSIGTVLAGPLLPTPQGSGESVSSSNHVDRKDLIPNSVNGRNAPVENKPFENNNEDSVIVVEDSVTESSQDNCNSDQATVKDSRIVAQDSCNELREDTCNSSDGIGAQDRSENCETVLSTQDKTENDDSMKSENSRAPQDAKYVKSEVSSENELKLDEKDGETGTMENFSVEQDDVNVDSEVIPENRLIMDEKDGETERMEKFGDEQDAVDVDSQVIQAEQQGLKSADKNCESEFSKALTDVQAEQEEKSSDTAAQNKNLEDDETIKVSEKVAAENGNKEVTDAGDKSVEPIVSDPSDEQKPESTIPDCENSEKKVQESEISESNQQFDDFDSYAKTLLQQAMDKLKEPIVPGSTGDTCDGNDAEKSKDVATTAAASSATADLNIEKKKKKKRKHEDCDRYTEKLEDSMGNMPDKKKRKKERNSSSSNSSKKTLKKKHNEPVIDLTEGSSSSPSKTVVICDKPRPFKAKSTSRYNTPSHGHLQKSSPFKRQGSANSPIVLSDTSSTVTQDNSQFTSSSTRSFKQPDITIKSISRNQISTTATFPSMQKPHNFADMIKSVTKNVLSGNVLSKDSVPSPIPKQSPVPNITRGYVNPMLNFANVNPMLNPHATSTPKRQLCKNIGGNNALSRNPSSITKVVTIPNMPERSAATSKPSASSKPSTSCKASTNQDNAAEPTSTQDLSEEEVVGSSGQPPEMGDVILLDDSE